MKATVLIAFGDKENGNVLYMPGDEFSADEKRVAELEAAGYVKRIAETTKRTTRKRTTKPKE